MQRLLLQRGKFTRAPKSLPKARFFRRSTSKKIYAFFPLLNVGGDDTFRLQQKEINNANLESVEEDLLAVLKKARVLPLPDAKIGGRADQLIAYCFSRPSLIYFGYWAEQLSGLQIVPTIFARACSVAECAAEAVSEPILQLLTHEAA